jgi:hypothetical protein
MPKTELYLASTFERIGHTIHVHVPEFTTQEPNIIREGLHVDSLHVLTRSASIEWEPGSRPNPEEVKGMVRMDESRET